MSTPDQPSPRDRGPDDPPPRPFPTLPIVSFDPAPPRRADREKYGGLYYLGTFGLAVVVFMVGWFAWQAWALRDVWRNVYVLHDTERDEADRVEAAYALAQDPRVNQRQRWDIALRKTLPPLARYVMAESLTGEAASDDPRGYGLAVSKSEGWPVWLRLLLSRPPAYAAALDLPVARDALAGLARNPDHATALWARYALAEGPDGDAAWAADLRREAAAEGPDRALAAHLVAALGETRLGDRLKALDAATLWLRSHHPEAARLWQGWEVVNGRLRPASRPAPAPKLQ